MKLERSDDLFIEGVKDVYEAEKQIIKTLPLMAAAAKSAILRQAFDDHLRQTEAHVERLGRILAEIEEAAGRMAIAGLREEGESVLDARIEDAACDAQLIAAAQKVEGYEMASYGCLRDWAEAFGKAKTAERSR
jgi:ferritin-like metal-binding protein YciE